MSSTLQRPMRRHHSRKSMTRAMGKHRHQATTSPPRKTHLLTPHLKARAETAVTQPRPKLQRPRQPHNPSLTMRTSFSIAVLLLARRWRCFLVQPCPYDLPRASRPLVNPSSAPRQTLKQRVASPRMNLSCSTDLCPPTARGANDLPRRQLCQRTARALFPQRRRRSLGRTYKRPNKP